MNHKMYRDIDENGNESITIYSGNKCIGSFLEDDLNVKDLEDQGIEIQEGLDNRT